MGLNQNFLCSHIQSVDVDDDSDQIFKLLAPQERQHEHLNEAFAHMQYVPKYHVQADL